MPAFYLNAKLQALSGDGTSHLAGHNGVRVAADIVGEVNHQR